MVRSILLAATALFVGVSAPQPRDEPGLRVGAAKVVITPLIAEMVQPFTRVADDIFVRAVVIDDGGRRAVLIVADVPTIQDTVAAEYVRAVAAQAHVARENVMLATTHTHNAMRVAPDGDGVMLPGSDAFVERVRTAIAQAVAQAQADLRPARIGSGSGRAYLVANRNEWSRTQGRFVDGVDRDGDQPIDHRLRVVAFEDSAGKPIAFLLNYAIEPVVAMALEGQISGDVPGATARYVEARTGGAPTLFTVGAAGSPLYRARNDGGTTSSYGRADPHALISASATILGEEALAVAQDIRTTRMTAPIASGRRPLVCPGKTTTPLNLPNRCAHVAGSPLPACIFRDADAPPVTLDLGLLRIGDTALVQTDANVTPALGRKLDRASSVADTWIVARTYGPLHYVVDDAAYPLNTYEATASTAKSGCAERGFLDGARALIDASR